MKLETALKTHLPSFRAVTLALGAGAAMVAFVCCGGDPSASSAETPDAAASVPSGDAAGGTPGIGSAFVPDAGHVDAGTVDTGRDNADVVVCGGSKGDPKAVPLLQWSVVASPGIYKVVLGAKSFTSEPILWSDNGAIVTGTVTEDDATIASAGSGGGPFGSGPMNRFAFAQGVMPATATAFQNLGYTEALQGAFDVATNSFDTSKVRRTGGSAYTVSSASWGLRQPVRGQRANDADFYVGRIDASRGFGWLFTVELDHPCKADALDALLGGVNPVDILAPPAPHSIDEVSRFLVDNNASLSLYVLTFGAEEPGVRAALQGTQASAATLDKLDAALTGVDAALKAYATNASAPDYASVTAGTNPSWVIGRVHYAPVSDLR